MEAVKRAPRHILDGSDGVPAWKSHPISSPGMLSDKEQLNICQKVDFTRHGAAEACQEDGVNASMAQAEASDPGIQKRLQ